MKIEDKKASKNPFTTTVGYFDSLPDRLLARLHATAVQPASTHTTCSTKIRPIGGVTFIRSLGYAAATLLLFTIGGYLYYNDISGIEKQYANIEEYSNDFFDDLYYNLDIDDYTIYSYLASSDTDL